MIPEQFIEIDGIEFRSRDVHDAMGWVVGHPVTFRFKEYVILHHMVRDTKWANFPICPDSKTTLRDYIREKLWVFGENV